MFLLRIDENGVLERVRKNEGGSGRRKQFLLATSKKSVILQHFQEGSTGENLRVKTTHEKLQYTFFWVHLKIVVQDWYHWGIMCNVSNGPKRRTKVSSAAVLCWKFIRQNGNKKQIFHKNFWYHNSLLQERVESRARYLSRSSSDGLRMSV